MDNKCKACGKNIDINADFCPYCKFPQFILPAEVSEDVLKYEEERASSYKKMWESKNEAENLPPLSGYLVMKQGNTYLSVFPIYQGKSVFGSSPEKKEGVFSYLLPVKCDELGKEHFMLEVTEEGKIIAKLLKGTWGLHNKSNNVAQGLICHTQSIYVGNLEFIFLEG